MDTKKAIEYILDSDIFSEALKYLDEGKFAKFYFELMRSPRFNWQDTGKIFKEILNIIGKGDILKEQVSIFYTYLTNNNLDTMLYDINENKIIFEKDADDKLRIGIDQFSVCCLEEDLDEISKKYNIVELSKYKGGDYSLLKISDTDNLYIKIFI